MTSGGGGNSSLVVPMVMWGPQAPTHCISAIYLMRDQKTLLTGASDGQVIIWEVDITTQKSSGNFYLNHIVLEEGVQFWFCQFLANAWVDLTNVECVLKCSNPSSKFYTEYKWSLSLEMIWIYITVFLALKWQKNTKSYVKQ